jgi:cytochrome P450
MNDALLRPLYMRRAGFDPAPELAALRDSGGIARVHTPFGRDAYLVTGYEAVRDVLADTATFSNGLPTDGQDGPDRGSNRYQVGNLLTMDPPEHSRLRRLLTPEFTVRRMRRLEPRIAEIVGDHLDRMEALAPPLDVVAHFALPIPSLVICELLGVPYRDRFEFTERSNRQLDTSLPRSERQALIAESWAYMARLVAAARDAPGEDMLGMLVREHGDAIGTDELVGVAALLLLAGHETTANMLGLGTLALLCHPDQLALVRDHPEAVGPAVEELLRWLSIVQGLTPRVTTAAVVLGSQMIPAGELVVCAPPAANRDPALIDEPERLDVRRGGSRHLAFGHGIHHCLGAPLARMELTIALPALLRRFPSLALAVPFEEVAFRVEHLIYGLHTLPVAW